MLRHAFENFYIEYLQKIHTPDETVSSVFNCHLANLNKVGLKPAEQKTVSAFFQPSLLAVMKLYNLHFFVLLLIEIVLSLCFPTITSPCNKYITLGWVVEILLVASSWLSEKHRHF